MKFSTCLGTLALAMVACSDGEGPDTQGQTGLAAQCGAPCKAPQLDKRVFLLESAQNFEPLTGSTVRLSFHEGNLSLSAGCNSLGGEFSLMDQRLVLREGGITEIGCDPERHAQDEFLWSFVQSSPQLELDGSTLTLTSASTVLVFRDRELADPDRPLVATPWAIDTFISNDSASNLPGPLAPTLLFAADGSLHFETGCNSGVGTYTVVAEQLTTTRVGSTNRACSGPSAAAEEHILKVLRDGTLSFEIEAGRLTLQHREVGLNTIAP